MNHDAAGYLDYLRRLGAPVLSTRAPLTPAELQAAVDRGPHPSAEAHKEFLMGEVLEMCERRHAMILPFSAVKHVTGVAISPPGVVPQAERRPRTINDHTYSGVNGATVNLAHSEAMQFGSALKRILYQIYRADPRWGPVHIAKVDISDGFYNITVNPNGAKQFGIILPSSPRRRCRHSDGDKPAALDNGPAAANPAPEQGPPRQHRCVRRRLHPTCPGRPAAAPAA